MASASVMDCPSRDLNFKWFIVVSDGCNGYNGIIEGKGEEKREGGREKGEGGRGGNVMGKINELTKDASSIHSHIHSLFYSMINEIQKRK